MGGTGWGEEARESVSLHFHTHTLGLSLATARPHGRLKMRTLTRLFARMYALATVVLHQHEPGRAIGGVGGSTTAGERIFTKSPRPSKQDNRIEKDFPGHFGGPRWSDFSRPPRPPASYIHWFFHSGNTMGKDESHFRRSFQLSYSRTSSSHIQEQTALVEMLITKFGYSATAPFLSNTGASHESGGPTTEEVAT